MAVNYVNARQKQKIATSSEWQTYNSVLLNGELGIESDTRKIKVGDGYTKYSYLPFLNAPIVKPITLFADSWDDRRYTIDDSNIKADSIIIFDAPVGVDVVDYSYLQNAIITAYSQTNGRLILQSLGVVPVTDLDVELAIF